MEGTVRKDGKKWAILDTRGQPIFKATTEGNCRQFEGYGEGYDSMDIWVNATVRTGMGFLIIGAYLTDIWSIGDESMADHYYTRYFKEV